MKTTEVTFIICLTIIFLTIIAALWTGHFFSGPRACREACGQTRMAEWVDWKAGEPEHCRCVP